MTLQVESGIETQGYGEDLLHCLEVISHLLNNPVTAESFKSMMPIGELGFTPALLERSVERFSFISKLVKKSLKDISEFTPCILLLHHRKSCVLIEIKDRQAIVAFPQDKNRRIAVPLRELERLYSGRAILMAYKPLKFIDEDAEKPLSWFWNTLKLFKRKYRSVIWSTVIINILLFAGTIYAMIIYDRVVPLKNFDTLNVLSLGVIIVYVTDFILRMVRGYFVDEAGKKADILLGAHLYERILGLKIMHRPPSSGGLAHYMKEFENVREFFSSTTIVSLIDVPFALLFLFGIWLVSPTMVLVPFCAVLLILISTFCLRPAFKGSVQNLLANMNYKHGFLLESLNSLETVKAINAEGYMLHQWEESVLETAGAANKVRYFSLLTANGHYFIQNLAYVALIVLGVHEVSAGHLTVGGLIAVTILTTRTIASVTSIASIGGRFTQCMASLNLLNKIICLPSERPSQKKFIPHAKLKGKIEFKDVTFSYANRTTPVLDKISFKIEPGEKVAIMGKVGCGKSSIAKLILGLYQSDSGMILVDNLDISFINPSDVRTNIGYVSQVVSLFKGDLRYNIMMPNPAGGDELMLHVSHIAGVHKFANVHPLGYEMPVEEGGEGLSGGERQAVSIARSLIRNPPILLFDEPTSTMDKQTEVEFIEKIQHYAHDKTLIIITHSSALLSLVDRVIILDQGNIVSDETL